MQKNRKGLFHLANIFPTPPEAAEEGEVRRRGRRQERADEKEGGGESKKTPHTHTKRGEKRGRVMMSSLSYKVLRGTCLRFPEQVQVIVAGDVLQQGLPTHPVALAVILSS